MGLFDLFARRPALSEGLEQYRNTSGAVLLDVRTPEEYRDGPPCPEPKNLPHRTGWIPSAEPAGSPLFVYCRSGARSAQAKARLRGRGIPSPIWGACWATAGRWKHREGRSMKVVIIGGVAGGATAAAVCAAWTSARRSSSWSARATVPTPTAACPTMWAV